MTTLALIAVDGTIVREADSDSIDLKAGTKEGFAWVPILEVRPESVDEAADTVEGPFDEVSPDGVTRTWRARKKTTEERNSEKAAALAGVLSDLEIAMYLDHENRVRVLEKRSPLDEAEMRSLLQARLA